MSDFATKTEIVLLKNSGIVVAVAMKVDAATSYQKSEKIVNENTGFVTTAEIKKKN